MEQIRKALSRSKTAFGIIENTIGIIDNDSGHVSPGREIYEIELAFDELEQSQEAEHETLVIRTGYLCELGGNKTFMVANNVAEAMDCLDKISDGEDYSMIIHHSIPIVVHV